MDSPQERVVIGMDPHKRSASIEVLDAEETVLEVGRFGTDADALPGHAGLRQALAKPGVGDRGLSGHRQAHRDAPAR